LVGFRRKIFYLGGYDPRGARFYHQLYQEQARLYAQRCGHDVVVSRRAKAGEADTVWSVEDRTAGASAQFTFLGWDAEIRRTWSRNPAALFWGAIASTLSFTLAWDWRGFARHIPRGTFIAFYYPALSVVLLPILLVALIWLLAGPIVALVIGIGISIVVARRIRSLWLLRFVIFNDRFARNRAMPELDKRLNEMAATIDAALTEDWDEVLLVTHSNGSVLAMPVMARLLERRGGRMPANFALMTLGSCIPLVGIRRDARKFQAQLETVAKGEFLWLDLGSLTDGACIPLVDPCVTCATAERPDLHVLSPRWFKYCDPATYQERRRNKYETHFEYLRSFERISPLDYLRVTSCAEPLAASIAAFAREPD
jgi:hypothetical protein